MCVQIYTYMRIFNHIKNGCFCRVLEPVLRFQGFRSRFKFRFTMQGLGFRV